MGAPLPGDLRPRGTVLALRVCLAATGAGLLAASLVAVWQRPGVPARARASAPAQPARAAPRRPEAAAAAADMPESPSPSRFSPAARRRQREVFASVRGDGRFVRLGEPQPDDWLWAFPEPGETLADYARARINRKTVAAHTLHLQPYADLTARQRRLIETLREHTAAYYDVTAAVLPARPLPARWYDRERGQYDADGMVRALAREVPAGSLGVIGLTGADLHALDLNFVFGVGLLTHRAGVFSLYRYRTPARQLFLRRALKVATHELGHMLSLKHCVFYRCVMNGSNSVAEMDGQPLHLCPVCLAKLHWNVRFDPAARFRRLEALYRRLGLAAEADFMRASLPAAE